MKIKDIILITKSLSFKEVLKYLSEKATEKGNKTFVVTINPEIIMLAKNDSGYEKVIKSADLVVNDSVGFVWAGKMFGKSFKRRVQGADLVDRLCETVSKKPITVGFVGGYENVAQRASERLAKKYPGLKVEFALSEWSREARSGSARPDLRCDILFVAFGSPKQEKWIYEYLPKIDVKVAIGVGGAFDFISGKVKRAPVWVRNIGLEWLFRLIIQPWRIKRQLALVKFVMLVLKERLFERKML